MIMKSYPATMLFEGIDYEECDVSVFDSDDMDHSPEQDTEWRIL